MDAFTMDEAEFDDALTSAHGMDGDSNAAGVRRVGRALRRARGRLTQKQAARHWGVSLATMAALEQGKVRHYGSDTLAQFDEMLGVSTWDLYEGFDLPDEGEAPTVAAEVQQVREAILGRLNQIEDSIAARLSAPLVPDALDQTFVSLAIQLTDAQRRVVVVLMRELLADG